MQKQKLIYSLIVIKWIRETGGSDNEQTKENNWQGKTKFN